MRHQVTTSFDTSKIQSILDELSGQPGALLPILHAIQAEQGYVPSNSIPLIADALNISRAEVHGVITYYHHFRQEPAGKHVVQICRAEACQSVGSEALADHAVKQIGCDFHETTKDGSITLEPVYCLGQCACGPAIMINDDVHALVDAAKLDKLLAKARSHA
jgi:formate dehydrogenase subunit gamma